MREKDGRKDERGEERGCRKSYLWFSVRLYLTAVRVSAAELALFHTGAILSPLGYCPPATATWEHLAEDKCLFSVCVCVREGVCTCSMFVRAQQLFQTIPSQPTSSPSPPSFAVCVRNCPISERFRGKSSQSVFSRSFPLCWGDIFVFFDPFPSATSPEMS